jgi:hypothetical protein
MFLCLCENGPKGNIDRYLAGGGCHDAIIQLSISVDLNGLALLEGLEKQQSQKELHAT